MEGGAQALKKTRNAHVWARAEREWYVEPERCTDQLLSVERFSGWIWDPACGGGNILAACLRNNIRAIGSDLVRRAPDRDGLREATSKTVHVNSFETPESIIY